MLAISFTLLLDTYMIHVEDEQQRIPHTNKNEQSYFYKLVALSVIC